MKLFFSSVLEEVKEEYYHIIERLENDGKLQAPYGEKVENNLFAIRVIQTQNIRVFYVYGKNDYIFGIHAYRKKTQHIPIHEKNHAIKVAKELQKGGAL